MFVVAESKVTLTTVKSLADHLGSDNSLRGSGTGTGGMRGAASSPSPPGMLRPASPSMNSRCAAHAARRCTISKDYEVGFCRPPKHTRFKAGESGNRSGRPKKKPTLAETEAKLLLENKFTVRVNGKPQRVNAFTAILTALIARAMNGDSRAAERLLKRAEALQEIIAKAERDHHAERAEMLVEMLRDTFTRP